MPPVYKRVTASETFDGLSDLDLRPMGINLIYLSNWLDHKQSTEIFHHLTSDRDILTQHSYIGNFNRKITPHRLTYAHVPDHRHYRFRGHDLVRESSTVFEHIFENLGTRLVQTRYGKNGDQVLTSIPDASVTNGYRYNGDDYIAPHTDDEKFLVHDTCPFWSDPTVCTVTFLRDPNQPMTYYAGDPKTGKGFGIKARHGSVIIQGTVLHEIRPKTSLEDGDQVSRISLTLRKFHSRCPHGKGCIKPNCLPNLGPSNYLYYSNSTSLPIKSKTRTSKTIIDYGQVIDSDSDIDVSIRSSLDHSEVIED